MENLRGRGLAIKFQIRKLIPLKKLKKLLKKVKEQEGKVTDIEKKEQQSKATLFI